MSPCNLLRNIRESSVANKPLFLIGCLLARTNHTQPHFTFKLIVLVAAWESITKDAWVLFIVRLNYYLPFKCVPSTWLLPSCSVLSALHFEDSQLLKKGVIEFAPEQEVSSGFYSRYFLVNKKDGGIRTILDLRGLNKVLSVPKFCMTTLSQVLSILEPCFWFGVISRGVHLLYTKLNKYPKTHQSFGYLLNQILIRESVQLLI